MNKVHCAYCKAPLTKEEALAIPNGRRFSYYCSDIHYQKHQLVKTVFDLACSILDITATQHLKDELTEIANCVGWKKLKQYLMSEGDRIGNKLNEILFYNSNAKTNYFLKMVTNEINDYEDGMFWRMPLDDPDPYQAPVRPVVIGMDELLDRILKEME